uniref:GLUG motif-containing protein n=1 Tax=Ruminococcus sp. TaxID=41978 RepID=UPI003AB4D45F
MKKKILSLLVTMGLAASLVPVSVFADGTEVWDGSIAESFAGGKGTKDDPYQIATGSQLAYFAKRVNAEEYGEKYADTYFELTEDIDLGGKEWTPVGETVADLIMGGHEYFVFSGNFDGNGYTIKNLTIGTETSPYSGDVCGLFGATSGTIEDVVLENVSINYVGGNHSSGYGFRMGGALVGYSMGDIVNCTVIGLDMKAGSDGSYVALNSIGGLVGIQDGGTTVSHSRVSGKIEESTKKGNVGGFVGTLAKGSSAKYCGADVSVEVTGNGRGIAVGGFVGIGNGVTTDETLIENCYATGNITGAEYAGGFVGNISGLNISNCYAKGDVSNSFVGASFMGTDAASNNYYGTVKNCYATGLVSDISSSAYAFAMQDTMNRSTIQNCYYNIQNTAKNTESAASLTIDDMKTDSFLNVLNGSSNVWTKRNNDTPACGAEPADYSNVYEVLGNIPADLSIYTDESVANLYSAVEALRGYRDLAQQSDVDKMTNDINDAVEALVYKSADYTELDKAEEAAKALNKDDYEDFSEVEKALAAIDRTKNITEQADVDAMVKAINDAVANLVKKAPASSQPDSVSSSDASSDTSSSTSDSSAS